MKVGCWGPVVQLQRRQARLDGRHRRLPERRRHLHRLHDAGLPRQVHAVHGRAARRRSCPPRRSAPTERAVRALRSFTNRTAQQRAEVAPQPRRADDRLPAALARLTSEEERPEMATTRERIDREAGQLVDMSWDPITRDRREPRHLHQDRLQARARSSSCRSTSSIFRGYSVFMKGKDPRDAHFITSRICGICGDNHAACSMYAQNMAYGIKTPHAGRVDRQPRRGGRVHRSTTTSSRTTWSASTSARRWCSATNPSVLAKAETTEAPRRRASTATGRSPTSCARSTRSWARLYREALVMSRLTREMFCLMEGRHVHPSTLYPGGVGTQCRRRTLFTDYLTRLLQLRGVHQARGADARRPVRLLLRGAARLRGGRPAARPARLLGRLQQPRHVRLRVPAHAAMGRRDVRHARGRRRRRADHHRPRRDQPRDPHPARQLLLRGLGRTRRRSSSGTRSATRSTSATRGTRPRCRDRRDATSRAATTRG